VAVVPAINSAVRTCRVSGQKLKKTENIEIGRGLSDSIVDLFAKTSRSVMQARPLLQDLRKNATASIKNKNYTLHRIFFSSVAEWLAC